MHSMIYLQSPKIFFKKGLTNFIQKLDLLEAVNGGLLAGVVLYSAGPDLFKSHHQPSPATRYEALPQVTSWGLRGQLNTGNSWRPKKIGNIFRSIHPIRISNLKTQYPSMFFDDLKLEMGPRSPRAHARKFAAKLQELKNSFLLLWKIRKVVTGLLQISSNELDMWLCNTPYFLEQLQ